MSDTEMIKALSELGPSAEKMFDSWLFFRYVAHWTEVSLLLIIIAAIAYAFFWLARDLRE